MAEFTNLLGQVLLQSVYSGANPDGSWRYGPPDKGADGKRLFEVPDAAARDVAQFGTWSALFPRFEQAYKGFADSDSSQLMTVLVAHYILGPERVALPITHAQYRHGMAELGQLLAQEHTYDVDFQGMKLDLYDLNPAGFPIRVHTTRSALLAHFFLKQYEFRRRESLVTVEPGDVVVEGGMCYGDTALLFAHMAGENGRVLGFEFEPNNLKVMKENLYLNPDLAKRVTVLHHALADVSGKDLAFAMAGPATTVLQPGQKTDREVVTVKTMTVDDLVARHDLPKVDFIKLDVEGAELETLMGSVETLKRFRPKLALSAYHKADDIPTLMAYVQSLDLGYRFWLDHFRPSRQETVLFAKC